MTRVFLLRHGATAVNRLNPYRLQGRGSNPPLDPIGNEQGRRAGEALAGLRLAAVYSSPLLRARQTADWVAGPHGLDPVAVPELTEADLGRWEGLTWDEARAQDPEYHDQFLVHPGTTPYPEGESFLDVSHRAAPAIAALVAAHPDENLVVVGHNVLNRAYLAPLLGLPIDLARPLRQANGGINLIEYDGPDVRIVTLNACLHLEGLSSGV